MLITPHVRIRVAIEPVDLRKGVDGLADLCREKLAADPFSGCLFVFRGRRAKAIKVLQYDGQGFVLAQKRLSKGKFRWWPTGVFTTGIVSIVGQWKFALFFTVLKHASKNIAQVLKRRVSAGIK
jgi:hypothetical protein